MGPLKDTIINFGQDLPEDEFTKATEEGEKADLCLAMGSSLTVTPAADIPEVYYSTSTGTLLDNNHC